MGGCAEGMEGEGLARSISDLSQSPGAEAGGGRERETRGWERRERPKAPAVSCVGRGLRQEEGEGGVEGEIVERGLAYGSSFLMRRLGAQAGGERGRGRGGESGGRVSLWLQRPHASAGGSGGEVERERLRERREG